jgi:hypothetical protein
LKRGKEQNRKNIGVFGFVGRTVYCVVSLSLCVLEIVIHIGEKVCKLERVRGKEKIESIFYFFWFGDLAIKYRLI